MKKSRKCMAVLMMMVLIAALPFAMAEDPALGNVPERGLILPMTQEDAQLGLATNFLVMSTSFAPSLPVLQIQYTDGPLFAEMQAAYLTDDLDEYTRAAMIEEMRTYCSTSVGDILLIEKEVYDSLMQEGASMEQVLGVSSAPVLGENEGYVYVCVDYTGLVTTEDAALMERLNTAIARANELMNTAVFQPLVYAEGAFDQPKTPFPAFTTTDLNGNTVTETIFAGKDLTVVNVWGTYCGPCIDEMDELAAWSASMPENVQLIGLVSDLYDPNDTDTLEMALAICEATGATNYPSLVSCVDFAPLLNSLVGVPTTFFVDSTGTIVGDPIVGANVPGCIAFVEEYLNGK